MKQPPTERHRTIAKRRLEGKTLGAVASEFRTTAERVRQITRRVEDYDRGAAMLREDPASIEALDLMGRLPAHARHTLRSNGIERITDLAGIPMTEMLRWPNIGRKSATVLLNLLAECQGDSVPTD